MAKRLLKDKLINLKDIKEKIKLIDNSDNYYISENGNIYVYYNNNLFLPKKNFISQGYYYCQIKINGKMISKRVHRLVAYAFIENPNPIEYKVVGHKNNIKTDNRKENLYWTSIKENTKKAYLDNLIKNDRGYEDSQSYPVYVLDMQGNILDSYGSLRECSKKLNISVSTISRQCFHKTKGKPRCGYRFRFQEEYNNKGFVL